MKQAFIRIQTSHGARLFIEILVEAGRLLVRRLMPSQANKHKRGDNCGRVFLEIRDGCGCVQRSSCLRKTVSEISIRTYILSNYVHVHA